MRVGWIGTGLMGLPMAGRALAAGHEVTFLRRRPETAEALVGLGATAADGLAAVAAGAEVVITVLPTPDEVRAVYLGDDGLIAAAAPGTVCVDMTTSSPDLAAELAREGAARDVVVLDAPVSGGPFGAEAGELSIMVGGDPETAARIGPLLRRFGSTIVHHGPAGSGQRAKLVNQVLVGCVSEATCEAFALTRASGLDPDRVRESLGAGAARSPLMIFLWDKLTAGDDEPGFKLSHLHKDLRLALDLAVGYGLDLGATARTDASATVLTAGRGNRGTQVLIEGTGAGQADPP